MLTKYYINLNQTIAAVETTHPPDVMAEKYLDFSGFDLSGQYFSRAQIKGYTFDGANLSNSYFDHCRFMEGTTFTGASLSHAVFHACDFNGVSFEKVNAEEITFEPSFMPNFWHCNFNQARLQKAHFNGYGFVDCSFIDTDLTDAVLTHCVFHHADLSKTVLRNSQCQDAHFIKCQLKDHLDDEAIGLNKPNECPTKAFRGYKKVLIKADGKEEPAIMELRIPKEAKRVLGCGLNREGRCNLAQVGIFYRYDTLSYKTTPLKGKGADGIKAKDIKHRKITYQTGKILSVDHFDKNPLSEQGDGISFYLTCDEAMRHGAP